MWMYACMPEAIALDLDLLKAGVVKVHSSLDDTRRTGSGFVVKLDGDDIYIVTASHVIEGDAQPRVSFHARRDAPQTARVLKLEGGDPRGIALLLVQGGPALRKDIRALTWAKDDALAGGEELITIGFGQGQGEWAVVRVNVTALDGRDLRLEGRIEEGNSGGPLLRDGHVVGMITGVRQGFGVASPGYLVTGTLRGWRVETLSRTVSGSDVPAAGGRAPVAPGAEAAGDVDSRRDRSTQQAEIDAPASSRPTAENATAAATSHVRLRAASIKVGRVTREESRLLLRDAVLTVNLAGQPLIGSAKMEQGQVIEREVLAATQGRITRERLNFREMRGRFTRELGEEREVDDRTNPLQGTRVIAIRGGEGWSFTAERGKLSDAQQRELLAYVFDGGDGYPEEPVAPGTQWEVHGDALRSLLQLGDFTVTEGRAVLRLMGVETCGVAHCARIAVAVNVAGVMLSDDGTQSALSLDGAGHLLRVVASDINRELKLTGRMTMAADVAGAGVPVGISVAGPFEYHGTTRE